MMVERRTFYLSPKIIIKKGAFEKIGEEAMRLGKKALLVTGRNFAKRTGLLRRAIDLLSGSGVEAVAFDKVEPEPSLETVEEGRTLARREGCDLIISIGGGSALDVGKTIAGLLTLPGTVREYFYEERKVESPGVPFMAIPTTAGTGAEVTNNSVLVDPEKRVKKSIRSPFWVARVTMVDPLLTLTAPPQVTASAGMDALSHAIEGYVSVAATPITDGFALHAIRLISHNLVRAHRVPGDMEAREKVALGSHIAAMGFANSGLGAVHGLAHPVGVVAGAPHGVVCGLLLPAVMEFNLPTVKHKYAKISQVMGVCTFPNGNVDEAAGAAIEAVRGLLRQLGLPTKLRELGLRREQLREIVKSTPTTGSQRFNPRPVSPNDLLSILEATF